MNSIRNFVIIAHIDHGKSTLADRMLEITGTVEKRKMREQFLDANPLEREKGITIKMAPVRMLWHPHRGITQNETQNNAEDFLYGDLTYKIRGVLFDVRKKLGLGHKEQVYHNALDIEFKKAGFKFDNKKNIPIIYDEKNIGTYQPDFVVENKVLIELKALPEISRPQIEQLWAYLKGCDYKLALLINFGSKELEIKRVVYDLARDSLVSAEGRGSYGDNRRSIRRNSASSLRVSAGVVDQIEDEEYIFNLIDTPGHVDFFYEVSRALAAVEGAILLVDATQGIQAQTLANLQLAQKENLVVIPVVNKIDLPSAEIEKTEEELAELLGVEQTDILKVSGKTGEGVEELLVAVVERVPSPNRKVILSGAKYLGDSSASPQNDGQGALRALIFDSQFDSYQGVVAHVRIVDGEVRRGDRIKFVATGAEAELLEVGVFAPEREARDILGAGEIGYLATGIKELEKVRVGDTVTNARIYADDNADKRGSFLRDSASGQHLSADIQPLAGYQEPEPMVFASIFPENQDEHEILRESLKKLKLNDAALFFEPEDSSALGRGFRAGFLGMLHMEIVSERLKREYGLRITFTNPSVAYRLRMNGREEIIYSAAKVPEAGHIDSMEEPWAGVEIITPASYLGRLTSLINGRSGIIEGTVTLGENRLLVRCEAPLREIIIDFYDDLKSISQGFASMSYRVLGFRRADLVRLDILVAGEKVLPLAEMVPRPNAYFLGRERVKKLKELLPRELFAVALQAQAEGRILARETIPAMKKDVTGYLYGGDRTRKMKLWKKQQKGKKKLKERGRVDIPPDVFMKMLKK